jgi:uncharacterized lipoprotein YddW (UPF0748 family)
MPLITLDESELQAQLTEIRAAIADNTTRITALENPPKPPTIPDGLRGLWIQANSNHETSRERIRFAASLGTNAAFVFVGHGREVTFQNGAGIPSNDSLEATIDEANQQGIDVYAALPSKYFYRADYPDQDMRNTTEYVQSNDPWLDFRNPNARALIGGLTGDLARYDIAGVCADYTRWSRHWYPGSGLTPDPVTATIEAMRQALEGTGKTLSASPISFYTHEVYGACTAYGQCWRDWIDRGIVDWVTPMVYGGQWHLDDRLGEWQTWGYLPDMVTAILSPCSSGDANRPKTDAAWRAELQSVQDAGVRGVVVFDNRVMEAHPSKAEILSEMW